LRCAQEHLGGGMATGLVGHAQWPAGPVLFVDEELVIFRTPEIRQDILVGPSRAAVRRRPLVIVLRMAARIDLSVDGTAAPKHAALWIPHLPAAHVLLGHCAVTP